jgi:hypothetical protein
MARPGRFIWKRASSAVTAAVAPHRASLLRLIDMPLTVIGIGLIDFGAFHYVHMIGWVVTGISLLVVEHMIADDEPPGTG